MNVVAQAKLEDRTQTGGDLLYVDALGGPVRESGRALTGSSCPERKCDCQARSYGYCPTGPLHLPPTCALTSPKPLSDLHLKIRGDILMIDCSLQTRREPASLLPFRGTVGAALQVPAKGAIRVCVQTVSNEEIHQLTERATLRGSGLILVIH